MAPANLASTHLQPGRLIVVGVSGGPDSMALLHFLHSQNYPILVASFNHRLRVEAEADLDFVREVATSMGLPFVAGSGDVAAIAARQGLSTEEAARELRYHFLFGQARESEAQAVVVGHTADDQAETVLMHLLRGAGISGLKGMPPSVILPSFDKNIPLVRPLLTWSRTETEAYCQQYKLSPRIDPTNTNTQYFRNRLRHELLPILEQYNPQIRQTLAKTALALQGDFELLNTLVESAWQKTVRATGPEFIGFDQAELKKLAPVLARNLFRKAALSLKPGLRDIDFDALERAVTYKPIDLAGGLKTYPEGNLFYLTSNLAALPTNAWPQLHESIVLTPGRFSLGNGWSLHYEEIISDNLQIEATRNSDKLTANLDADLVTDQLLARTFRSGDYFEPLGMPRQTTKLAELFINQKVPKRLRRGWPVICAGERIAWVPGLRFAEPFKITTRTRRVIKIQIKKEEEHG